MKLLTKLGLVQIVGLLLIVGLTAALTSVLVAHRDYEPRPTDRETRVECVGRIVIDEDRAWETYGEIDRDLILNEMCPHSFKKLERAGSL